MTWRTLFPFSFFIVSISVQFCSAFCFKQNSGSVRGEGGERENWRAYLHLHNFSILSKRHNNYAHVPSLQVVTIILHCYTSLNHFMADTVSAPFTAGQLMMSSTSSAKMLSNCCSSDGSPLVLLESPILCNVDCCMTKIYTGYRHRTDISQVYIMHSMLIYS